MANTRPSHRRILAAAAPPPPEPKASSMEPTLRKQTKPSASHHLSYNLDPTLPSKPSSRVNASQRAHHTTQAKAMSTSAILDDDGSSRFSAKPTKELVCKDKLSKPSRDLVEKKRVEEVVAVKKKKEPKKESEFDGRRLSVSMAASGGDGGGRRRSSVSGSSQVQLADVFASNGVKIVSVDMPPFMQIHAVECARKTHDSLEKFTSKTLALTLKKEFDGVYGPAWHCIVGTSFGSFVTHSVSGFLYFSMDQKLYILLFKTTVQRAE